MMTAGARASARQHPFFVDLYDDWSDHDPVTVGFQSIQDARRFAASRPEPIIDLVRRGTGVRAVRRMIPHPAAAIGTFVERDDFPQED